MEAPTVDLRKLDFDPSVTFDSGQVFRWRPIDAARSEWLGIISGTLLRVSSKEVTNVTTEGSTSDFQDLASRYFSFQDDLHSIFSRFPKDDSLLNASLNSYRGLRLLTQDPWECLISFVCSINANIPSIRCRIENLCAKYGRRLESSLNDKMYAFPSARVLAKAEKNDLLACKVGFRWRYIKFIAESVERGELDLERLPALNYFEACSELTSEISGKTLGVGPKVADCVLLYSLHKTEAFPIDVWMLKCIRNFYSDVAGSLSPKSLTLKSYRLISESMRNRFGSYAGYAQLYLYEKIRRESMTTLSKARA
jgi:N-glycosylase/DNA lyase